jgi:prolyl 4-hydroxylase
MAPKGEHIIPPGPLSDKEVENSNAHWNSKSPGSKGGLFSGVGYQSSNGHYTPLALGSPMIISKPSPPQETQYQASGHHWVMQGGHPRLLCDVNHTHMSQSVACSQHPTTQQPLAPQAYQGMFETSTSTAFHQTSLVRPRQGNVFPAQPILDVQLPHSADVGQWQACMGTASQQLALPVFSPPVPIPRPIYTVQDLPPNSPPPVYNMINLAYPGATLLHSNPPVFAVENFLSEAECNHLIHLASDSFGPAPVVGKGTGEISTSRTSSTCYIAREDVPSYMSKVTALTQKPVEHCELPQIGRYLPTQQYLQHYDAFDLSNEDGVRFAANGGQRVATVLVYLNSVSAGGCTHFPRLNLHVSPRHGMALVFFPATVDGNLDQMLLHAAEPAVDTKYVSQVWIRQGAYHGQASKRVNPGSHR